MEKKDEDEKGEERRRMFKLMIERNDKVLGALGQIYIVIRLVICR